MSEKERKLTFKRDENGVLWSYDVETGEKVGQIFEHGDGELPKGKTKDIDDIKEV